MKRWLTKNWLGVVTWAVLVVAYTIIGLGIRRYLGHDD